MARQAVGNAPAFAVHAVQEKTLITAGLTGGIATGKSTVASFFRAAGAHLIDADRIAHQVVKKQMPAWQAVVDCFGHGVLLSDGEIDRPKLADLIFNDVNQQRRLNEIVHPYVIKEINRQLAYIRRYHPDAVVILDVPLLFEAGMDQGLPEVIVVYTPRNLQLRRLMARDALTEKEALARVRSQMDIEDKRARATIVIDNSGSVAQTRKQTLRVFAELRNSAVSRDPTGAT